MLSSTGMLATDRSFRIVPRVLSGETVTITESTAETFLSPAIGPVEISTRPIFGLKKDEFL